MSVSGMSGSAGSLPMRCTTSARKPSTPRSSQKRSTSCIALDHLGVVPVEVGLLGQEGVQVPLLGGLVPGPRGPAAERRGPVVGRDAPACRRASGTSRAWASRATRGSRRTTGAGRRCGWGPSPAARGGRARARRRAARRRPRGRRRAGRRRSSRPRRSRSRPSASGRWATARSRRRRASCRWSRRARRPVEVADAVARRVGERARIDLVDDGLLPPHAVAKATDRGRRRPVRVAPMADVKRIGVVGGGFMGSGIAESAARAGVAVAIYEPEAATARALAHLDRGLGRARGAARQAQRGRGGRARRAHRLVDRPRRPRRGRARRRGDRRGRGGQGADLLGARRRRRRGDDPRVEHLVDPDRRAGGRDRPSRPRARPALLLAGAGHEARRGGRRPRHLRRDRRARPRASRRRSARPRSRPRIARASSSTSCSCPT